MDLNFQARLLKLCALCAVLFVVSVATASAAEESTFLPVVQSNLELNQTESAPLCRFGVNAPGSLASFDFAPLRLGWYINYTASMSPYQPNGIKYTPIIRLRKSDNAKGYVYTPSGNQLVQTIQNNPGAIWFIGNEPDRPDLMDGTHVQDELAPHLYAQVYHELYTLIKGFDPSAQIFAGSIVQPTELRLRYLDLVLESYRSLYQTPMPVDGWSIHNFILNEASCAHFPPWECWGAEIPPGVDAIEGIRVAVEDNDNINIFKEQIRRFRQWTTSRGYQGVPVYLSEYGILMPVDYGFDESRVNAFMTATFDYLRTETDSVHGNPADGYRLIQRFSWYSMSDTGFNGRLFNPDNKQRTLMGDNYAAYTANIPVEADFYPLSVQSDFARMSSSIPATVTLKATIANSGNTAEAYNVRVRFYKGDPAQGGQQIGTEQVVSLAGCGQTAEMSAIWSNVPAGLHQVYVQVEPVESTAPESSAAKANNTQSHSFIVGGEYIFLPRINR